MPNNTPLDLPLLLNFCILIFVSVSVSVSIPALVSYKYFLYEKFKSQKPRILHERGRRSPVER